MWSIAEAAVPVHVRLPLSTGYVRPTLFKAPTKMDDAGLTTGWGASRTKKTMI
jgi:hypothetical protein